MFNTSTCKMALLDLFICMTFVYHGKNKNA